MIFSKNFTKEELSCRCGCGTCNVSGRSLSKLQEMRDIYSRPIRLNRASSCIHHNRKVGGSEISEHIATKEIESCGFDIAIRNDRERFELISLAFKVGFSRIGVYSNFIHVGDSLILDQQVFWKK